MVAAPGQRPCRRSRQPNVETHLAPEANQKVESERGDAAKAFGAAAIQLDQTYDLPPETHNPIELHASVALWDGSTFTLYETSQGVVNHRNVLAQMLGVAVERTSEIMEGSEPGCAYYTSPEAFTKLQHMAIEQARRDSEAASKQPGPKTDMIPSAAPPPTAAK